MNEPAVTDAPQRPPRAQLPKTPSGIQGLDEITGGGLPKGRPTLVCGGTGCGKTLLAMEFLVRGAQQFNEPGVFMAFEESARELTLNVASLGFDLNTLVAEKKLLIDFVSLESGELEEAGQFNLDGLFVRLGQAIDEVGARRVVLDTLDSLFTHLPNTVIVRAELRRLFRWLKDKGITAIITSERGSDTLTRQGLEEYVSDCVITLDHRVHVQTSVRRLRVVKYRGSTHGTDEYPFLIDEDGFYLFPVASMGLQNPISTERVSSGLARLDDMLGGAGFYKGSSVLVSGMVGTGKSSLAAHFCEAACRRGERALYFAMEESPDQILRNMRSIGIDLEPWVTRGLLLMQDTRPTLAGLEMQLSRMYKTFDRFQPQVVVVDPLNGSLTRENAYEVGSLLVRLLDFIKTKLITSFAISTISASSPAEVTELGMSTLIDTWLTLRNTETGGERNRTLNILKSRGMAHSNQIREYRLTDHGLDLHDVSAGVTGGLTGSARLHQQALEQASLLAHQQETERRQRELKSQRRSLEAQISEMRAAFNVREAEAMKIIDQELAQAMQMTQQGVNLVLSGQAGAKASHDGSK